MKDLGNGIAWFGFWLMIGLSNFGESRITNYYVKSNQIEDTSSITETVVENLKD